jgi:glucose-6-phosphate 1-dehydrogenase
MDTKEAQGRVADPCAMVIFGAAGDLTKRKLVPALYNLAHDGLLSKNFAVIGFARREMDTEQFRAQLAEEMPKFATAKIDPALWDWLLKRIYYVNGTFEDPAGYRRLKETLALADKECGTGGNYLHYLSTPPSVFSVVANQLGAAGLVAEENGQWRRVVVEKPFGTDLLSAQALNRDLSKVLDESQIYRIDHYLGKETVQNIMAFRFANGIFEPIWNRRYIDSVQITVAETVGVEGRGNYYETAGALRDMVQNHMFQLMALVAMEPPISFHADAVRDERVKILRAIQPLSDEDILSRTVRGQYKGYRGEKNVSHTSPIETFVALRLLIDNWRWAGVPFYLRTGKALAQRMSEVVIQFKRPPFTLFRETPVDMLHRNTLILKIQPEEGISMSFQAKIPGPIMHLGSVDMSFKYTDYFGATPSTGYERLLYDCMTADATLFHRADMVEAGWSVVTPMLDVWKALPPRNFPNYLPGSWGPKEADDLLERDGRQWKGAE